jgi:uncharacterized membrane protein YfbV (UPF0208 family)
MSVETSGLEDNKIQHERKLDWSMAYGNNLTRSQIKKIIRWQKRLIRKFNYDPDEVYTLGLVENKELGPIFGVKNVVRTDANIPIDPEKAVLCATVRAGFGPHRASIAIASCAYAMGLQPLWLDLRSIPGVPADLMEWFWDIHYGRLSRLSQINRLFDKFVWEPVTSGKRILRGLSNILNAFTVLWSWKYLKTYMRDVSTSQLFTNLFAALPPDLPIITTHSWNAQAAIAAGMKNVYNLILDNWPVAFWLAEGSEHCVQTPSSYYGYRTLTGFTEDKKILQPIPSESIHNLGHFVDHELVSNVETDCADRLARDAADEPRRFLLSFGGAGAQLDLFKSIIEYLAPFVKLNQAVLLVNLGDHRHHLEPILKQLSEYKELVKTHYTWESTVELVESIRKGSSSGINIFLYEDMLHAVYATNYLMRVSDVLLTKPSELAFYPVPKILIRRVGAHEVGGAIRCSELGEGTTETTTIAQTINAINLFLSEKDLITSFCSSIIKNKNMGVYDGAYNVLKMTLNKIDA